MANNTGKSVLDVETTVCPTQLPRDEKSDSNGTFFPKIDVPRGKMLIILPDMFTSCMSLPPIINPHYLEVKAESETWIFEALDASDKLSSIIAKCDFSLFCAISAPHANKAELRTLCDWGNWVFPFDDQFDNGALREDPTTSRKIMENLLAIMNDGCGHRQPMNSLVKIHDTVWNRIAKVSSRVEDVQGRFREAMIDYCNGAVEAVNKHVSGGHRDVHEYMEIRRQGVGVTPLIAMVEYAHGINIPDSVYKHKSFKELRRICSDVIILQNDMLSYPKEESEDVTENIIAVLRANGKTTQEAFDEAGILLKQCYRDFYLAQADLPHVNTETDVDIKKYVDGVHNIMLANLNWSFKSERYLPLRMNSLARKYRTIFVRERPEEKAIDIKSYIYLPVN